MQNVSSNAFSPGLSPSSNRVGNFGPVTTTAARARSNVLPHSLAGNLTGCKNACREGAGLIAADMKGAERPQRSLRLDEHEALKTFDRILAPHYTWAEAHDALPPPVPRHASTSTDAPPPPSRHSSLPSFMSVAEFMELPDA